MLGLRRNLLVGALAAPLISLGLVTLPAVAAPSPPTDPGTSSTSSTSTSTSTSLPTVPPPSTAPPTVPGRAPDDTPGAKPKLSDQLLDAVQAVQMLQQQLGGLQSKVDSASRAVAAADQVVARAKGAARQADARLDESRRVLRLLSVSSYVSPDQNGLPRIVRDLNARQVERDQTSRLLHRSTVRAAEAALARSRAAAKRAHHRLRSATDRQERAAQALSTARADLDRIHQTLADNLKTASDLRDKTAQIAESQAGGGSIGALLARRQRGELPPPVSPIFAWPLASMHMTSPFGYRTDPISGAVGFHPGADFGAAQGTQIRAPANGTVVIAGPEGGYGNCTVIDHGHALATLYGHQSVQLVHVGDRVKKGDLIGLVGSTGYSTGPHLHFEVRILGQLQNPIPWLNPPPT